LKTSRVRKQAVPSRGLSTKTEADDLAALCAQARAELTKAGKALHDDVGPLLTAAGFRLQLARMDVPDAANPINEALQILDKAMDQVRALSQKLHPSPAHRGGLKNALLQLAEQHEGIALVYSATTNVPVEIAAALHEAASAAVAEAARQGAERIDISVKGASGIRIRISDNGRTSGRTRALSIVQRIAREAGIVVEISTGKSTIVSISYAARRSASR
jgi:signal transduction histidine kinase